MPLVVEPNGPVTDRQLEEVERELGVSLPEEYRRWLLRTGGGDLFDDVAIPGTDEFGLISELDGIDRLPYLQRLRRNEVVPDDYIVVTLGQGGSLALRVRNGDEGSVWWVNYDLADDLGVHGPTDSVMLRVAEDFDMFLMSLP